jgi:hypothetical protein
MTKQGMTKTGSFLEFRVSSFEFPIAGDSANHQNKTLFRSFSSIRAFRHCFELRHSSFGGQKPPLFRASDFRGQTADYLVLVSSFEFRYSSF